MPERAQAHTTNIYDSYIHFRSFHPIPDVSGILFLIFYVRNW